MDGIETGTTISDTMGLGESMAWLRAEKEMATLGPWHDGGLPSHPTIEESEELQRNLYPAGPDGGCSDDVFHMCAESASRQSGVTKKGLRQNLNRGE